MKELLFLILLTLWLAIPASAQETGSIPPMPETGIKVSYLGTIIYPGVKIGIERPFKVIQVDKKKKWGAKTILKERYLSGTLGLYHHETYHDNLFFLLERQQRRQSPSGWFTEAAPGIGFSRTFLGEETYEVSEEGLVEKKSLAGNNYLMASVSLGAGYNFAVKGEQPIKVFGKMSMMGFYPSNGSLLLRPSLELGLVYSPKFFWTANPNIKHKSK